MKTLRYIALLLVLIACTNLKAQTSPEGTWHYENGNRIFIVKLWRDDGNFYLGHYEMRELNNGQIGNIIFTSKKLSSTGRYFPPTLSGIYSNFQIGGSICDNTTIGDDDDCKDGDLSMSFTGVLSGCTTCIETASWKIKVPDKSRL